MKIAIYARVSTSDQRADLQLDALHNYATARKLIIHREYVDEISGAKDSRPALDAMMADARRRCFDTIVVWKIDRLGRSTIHLLNVLTELQILGVAFVSLQEAIDTTTPAGKMVFTFLGAVAEFERSIIRERVKSGMAAAKRRGQHCGRPKMAVDNQKINAMKATGKSLRVIARSLGISHQTVANALTTS